MHLPHDLHLGCYKEEQQHLCFPRFSTPDGPLSFPLPLSLVESPSQFAEAHFLPPLPFLSLSLFPRRTLPPSRSLYFILFFFRFVSFFFSFVFLSQLSIHSAGIVYRLSEEISRELEFWSRYFYWSCCWIFLRHLFPTQRYPEILVSEV
ncbi:hypothetical protein I3842_16G066800 [Carya illinoinensis]|uniref:Transmembrane protein n=1 Tax=Carya illinoinensis TaxID=32201 RepID=A0A922A730_CARIL|nr:hypothetical protein I3842_16G066800 [Carya illinoinensis]